MDSGLLHSIIAASATIVVALIARSNGRQKNAASARCRALGHLQTRAVHATARHRRGSPEHRLRSDPQVTRLLPQRELPGDRGGGDRILASTEYRVLCLGGRQPAHGTKCGTDGAE